MSNRIVVIGGGAAGLMASVLAAGYGCEVTLLEKNNILGKKLLITGKGRCNVTNDSGVQDVMKNIPRNPRFLYSALTAFPPSAAMEFFESRGVRLKTERGDRVFPRSDKSSDIVNALEKATVKNGVKVVNCGAEEILTENGMVVGVKAGGKRYECQCVLVATGGVSYRATGSDGWGHRAAEKLGHTVTELRASLVPLEAEQDFCAKMQGLSLKNTALFLYNQKGKKVFEDFGEMMFTHFGVTGPMILSASAHMKPGEKYYIKLDVKPALSESKLNERILRDFGENLNRDIANCLPQLMPKSMIPVALEQCGIAPDTKVNSVTKEQRRKLVEFLKQLRIDIVGPRPINEAIVTSGGVKVNEINPGSMESKLVHGLFFAGEIIDVDAYTGGFNLQIAWATAAAAARGMRDYEVQINE